MKKYFLPPFFLLFGFFSFAQNNSWFTESQFSATILLPGLEYEAPVSGNSTASLRLGTGFGYASGMFKETEFGVFLNLRGQYRYFYNFQKRLEKEKNINNNSANYFGLHAAFSNDDPIIGDMESAADYSGIIGPVWGIQRVHDSGFKFNIFFGGGYAFNDIGGSALSPIVGLSMGWIIFD